MTNLIIRRTERLRGVIAAPPSKAYTHRAFIASSLSNGTSNVKNPLICDDTEATMQACMMIGAEIHTLGNGVFRVKGNPKPKTPKNIIYCGGSGSTIRFMTPICALPNGISILTGDETLLRRPMQPLIEALNQLGVKCYSANYDGYPPIIVFGGGIKGGEVKVRGDISSQFISGLLFASPMAEEEVEITLTTRFESKPYISMTLDTIMKHNIEIEYDEDYRWFHIPPKQEYSPADHKVEGDFSSAAFILAAAAITDSDVKVYGLKRETLQGDRRIINILEDMGVNVRFDVDHVEVHGSTSKLRSISIDLRDNPDLIPVCTVLASLADGRTVINGVRRLRFKESDRIAALSEELGKMGVKIKAEEDRMIIEGEGNIHGAEINPHNDHRIAMACAVAALRAEGETVIHRIECINKSYPSFIRDLYLLGGRIIER